MSERRAMDFLRAHRNAEIASGTAAAAVVAALAARKLNKNIPSRRHLESVISGYPSVFELMETNEPKHLESAELFRQATAACLAYPKGALIGYLSQVTGRSLLYVDRFNPLVTALGILESEGLVANANQPNTMMPPVYFPTQALRDHLQTDPTGFPALKAQMEAYYTPDMDAWLSGSL